MPYCPNCKEEYEDGVTICKECNSALVDKLDVPTKEKFFANPTYEKRVISFSLIIGAVILIFSPKISYEITQVYFNNKLCDPGDFKFILYATYIPFLIIGVALLIIAYKYTKILLNKKLENVTKKSK
ncbi:MAG: hypothetical protein N4A63_14900 [Vallitalea sp.]|jgi:hypothetical protein|nr:hypothetical protein [Vallitalea sp.]